MKKRWRLLKKCRNSVLAEWIFAGVLILMIPMTFVIFNAFYSRQMIQDKLEEMSGITLNNIRYSIDDYLSALRESAYYILMGNPYQNLEKFVVEDERFSEAVDTCYRDLKNKGTYNRDIESMIYLPERDFIITNWAANEFEAMYNSIKFKYMIGKEDREEIISENEWRELLKERHKNDFLISTKIHYQKFGSPSLVYAFTNPYSFQKDPDQRMNVYTSVSCDFIDALLEKTDKSTLFIVDEQGNQVFQFGSLENAALEHWSELLAQKDGLQEFSYEKEKYVYSQKKSEVADWYYVLAVPKSQYFDSIKNLTDITVAGIVVVAFLGVAVIFVLNQKNYRKIRTIMELLPSGKKKEEGKNELDILYAYYQSMNEENLTLKQFLESREDSIRKLFLMDKLKGRNSYLSDDDMINSLNIPLERQWVVASVYTKGWNDGHDLYSNENYSLINFSIKNVIDEIFADTYSYEILEDGDNIVLLFSLSEEERIDWKEHSGVLFKQMYAFFQERFQLQLSIIVSGVCEMVEWLSSCYSSVQEAMQYQVVLQNYGVIWVDELAGSRSEGVELWEEYRQKFLLLSAEGKGEGLRQLVDELFLDSAVQEEELYVVRCQIDALIGALLLRSRDMLLGRKETKLKTKLAELAACDTWVKMKMICMEIIDLLTKKQPEKEREQNRFILDIKEYVEQEYSNQDLNISMISEVFKLSPSHLSKLFKNETGIGLLSYINDIRIRKAQELLCSTRKTIYEIAEQVGYANVRSFQRNFTAIVGESPNDYRKEHGR